MADTANITAVTNAMTVDVEDYFQVQALAGRVARSDWEDIPLTANWWEEIEAGIEGVGEIAFSLQSIGGQ